MNQCAHCDKADQEAFDRAIVRMRDDKDHPMIETDMTAYRLADEAIGMFLEYRDVHGYSEQDARVAAAEEIRQGIDAEAELRAAGEIR